MKKTQVIINEGDIVSWQGASRLIAATVERTEEGRLIVRTEGDKLLPLENIRKSRSFAIVYRKKIIN